MSYGNKYGWSMPELERARVLAFEVGLPSGSIAKMLRHEFGSIRTPATIRTTLRRNFDWRGKPRGDPSALRRKAA